MGEILLLLFRSSPKEQDGVRKAAGGSGVDLSGEKVIGRTPISEAEALSRMDEAHKEYLRKRIKEFAVA